MKKFYIKEIDNRGKIKIFIVDGFIVRRDLDEEFTNFGQHFRFKCIPKYEFWLDKEASPDEKNFFIDHLLTEWKLMKEGKTYEEAIKIANKKESAERKKLISKKRKEGFHTKLFKKTKEGLKIWIVDGKLVRNKFDIKFTEGGHEFVYDYVPKNEIWIDNDITAKERKYVILHELFERNLMEKGSNYEKAHTKASKIEWLARHNNNILKEELKKLNY